MMEKLKEIERAVKEETTKIKDAKSLELARVKYLGRRGALTQILRSLKDRPLHERKEIGPAANRLKTELEELFEKRLQGLAKETTPVSLDITKPGKKAALGYLHPLTIVEEEVRGIFTRMNFGVAEGPEIETEFYNFDALNIPKDHPAREMWDTFWLKPENQKSKIKDQNKGRLLLRTHTSPVQVRYMEAHNPPFQIIVPGRCFRYEATDQTHDFQFEHIEGLMVGKTVSLANFKHIVEIFLNELFKREMEFELRPAYFPFVEPGWEVYMKRQNKWLEIGGAGMVHPRVFEAVHYNPRDWQGFAFGFGLERLAMIKYKIDDIRLFNSGDLRFINQF